MQILIFGMHRSGTSMTTRLINMMGAYFGPEGSIGEITDDNPKGFWERPEVFKLNEAILESKGCTWSNLQKWSFSDAEKAPDELISKAKKIILGMDAFRPWVLKDPRFCLLFPAWRPYLEVPIAVIVHRNPLEIAISLQKRDNLSLEYSIALWEHYAVGALNSTLGLPRIFVHHSNLHKKPVATCEYIYEQLIDYGVRRIEMPSQTEIMGFIDPILYRSKSESIWQNQDKYKFSDSQKALVEMLRGDREQESIINVSEDSKAIITSATKVYA